MVGHVELIVGKELPRHPEYDRQANARRFWRRSDKAAWDYAGTAGSAAHDATGTNAIVPQHERETDDRYKRRLSQSIARPYMRQILDRYNDHVYRVPAARPPAKGEYGVLMKDANGSGTPLPALMKKATRRAQAQGACYLLADSNQAEVYQTKAQENAAGKRGIVNLVNADQVLWWRTWQGQVVEAFILLCDRDGVDFGFYVTETTTQRVEIKKPEKDERAGKWTVASLGEEIAHSYGGCPLVALMPVFGEDDDEDEAGDSSQGAPLAESIKRICNIESWLHEENQGLTFTTTVFIGVTAEQVKDLTIGPGHAVVLEKDSASLDKLGADPAQAESLRTTLSGEVTELYRAAGLESGSPTEVAAPESGVAKAFKFNEIEAKLSAIAQAAENAENLVVKRLSAGNGWTYPGDAKYPADFALPDLAEELDYVIRLTTAQLPQILKDKAVTEYAQVAFKLDDKEQKTLASQLEQMAEQAEIDRQTNPPDGKFGT